jgi:diacylglycerol kinase family enzyme
MAVPARLAGPIHLIVNPASGSRKAPECEWSCTIHSHCSHHNFHSAADQALAVIENHVEPLLHHLGLQYDLHETDKEGDGSRIGQRLLKARRADTASEKGEVWTLIVAGGDGTAHELIEGILSGETKTTHSEARDIGRWELVILPLGTVGPWSEGSTRLRA